MKPLPYSPALVAQNQMSDVSKLSHIYLLFEKLIWKLLMEGILLNTRNVKTVSFNVF